MDYARTQPSLQFYRLGQRSQQDLQFPFHRDQTYTMRNCQYRPNKSGEPEENQPRQCSLFQVGTDLQFNGNGLWLASLSDVTRVTDGQSHFLTLLHLPSCKFHTTVHCWLWLGWHCCTASAKSYWWCCDAKWVAFDLVTGQDILRQQ